MQSLRHLVVVTVLTAAALFGQTDRRTITGTVSDPANAVPGAKVVLRNTDTGATAETISTQTGNYTLASLPAGNYEMSIEALASRRL